MEILIISGLSGGGKSKAASFLEDMGFYIVDNMPAGMIMKFAEFCAGGGGRYARVALVYDVRTAESFNELFDVLDKLKAMEGVCRMLFLDASPAAIIKRYKETRRRHPLERETDSLEEAVEKVFDLRPAAIIRDLDLRKPIYRQLAAYGHFGREDLGVAWEKTDRVEALKAAL